MSSVNFNNVGSSELETKIANLKSIVLSIVHHLKKTNRDALFLTGSFIAFTILAFYYGIKNNVYYTLEGIPTYWIHLSYHYLATGWTWILILPLLIGFRKYCKTWSQFINLAIILSLPIAVFHRFLSFCLDNTFRWSMGYTDLNPFEAMITSQAFFVTGTFDSVLVYGIIIASMYMFYSPLQDPTNYQKPISSSKSKTFSNISTKIPRYPNFASQSLPLKRIVAKKNGRLVIIKVKDISLFRSEGNYLKIFYGKEWVIIRETLTKMQSKLDPELFFRINRSTIINIDFVQELQPWFNGKYSISLKDDSVIYTSKTYRQNIDRLLKN